MFEVRNLTFGKINIMKTEFPLFVTCVHSEGAWNGSRAMNAHCVTVEPQWKVIVIIITLITENILHEFQHILVHSKQTVLQGLSATDKGK